MKNKPVNHENISDALSAFERGDDSERRVKKENNNISTSSFFSWPCLVACVTCIGFGILIGVFVGRKHFGTDPDACPTIAFSAEEFKQFYEQPTGFCDAAGFISPPPPPCQDANPACSYILKYVSCEEVIDDCKCTCKDEVESLANDATTAETGDSIEASDILRELKAGKLAVVAKPSKCDCDGDTSRRLADANVDFNQDGEVTFTELEKALKNNQAALIATTRFLPPTPSPTPAAQKQAPKLTGPCDLDAWFMNVMHWPPICLPSSTVNANVLTPAPAPGGKKAEKPKSGAGCVVQDVTNNNKLTLATTEKQLIKFLGYDPSAGECVEAGEKGHKSNCYFQNSTEFRDPKNNQGGKAIMWWTGDMPDKIHFPIGECTPTGQPSYHFNWPYAAEQNVMALQVASTSYPNTYCSLKKPAVAAYKIMQEVHYFQSPKYLKTQLLKILKEARSLYGTSIRDTQFEALSECTGPSQAYPAACIRSHVLDIDDAGSVSFSKIYNKTDVNLGTCLRLPSNKPIPSMPTNTLHPQAMCWSAPPQKKGDARKVQQDRCEGCICLNETKKDECKTFCEEYHAFELFDPEYKYLVSTNELTNCKFADSTFKVTVCSNAKCTSDCKTMDITNAKNGDFLFPQDNQYLSTNSVRKDCTATSQVKETFGNYVVALQGSCTQKRKYQLPVGLLRPLDPDTCYDPYQTCSFGSSNLIADETELNLRMYSAKEPDCFPPPNALFKAMVLQAADSYDVELAIGKAKYKTAQYVTGLSFAHKEYCELAYCCEYLLGGPIGCGNFRAPDPVTGVPDGKLNYDVCMIRPDVETDPASSLQEAETIKEALLYGPNSPGMTRAKLNSNPTKNGECVDIGLPNTVPPAGPYPADKCWEVDGVPQVEPCDSREKPVCKCGKRAGAPAACTPYCANYDDDETAFEEGPQAWLKVTKCMTGKEFEADICKDKECTNCKTTKFPNWSGFDTVTAAMSGVHPPFSMPQATQFYDCVDLSLDQFKDSGLGNTGSINIGCAAMLDVSTLGKIGQINLPK